MAKPVNTHTDYNVDESRPENGGIYDTTIKGRDHNNISDQHNVHQDNLVTELTFVFPDGTGYSSTSTNQGQSTINDNHTQATSHHSDDNYLYVDGEPVLFSDTDYHQNMSSNDQGVNFVLQNHEDPGKPLHFNSFGDGLI